MMFDVVPGILEEDIAEVEKKLNKMKGWAETVMVDIVDGKFSNNKTIQVEELADLGKGISKGVQLMTEEPISQVDTCSEVLIDIVIGHIELMKDQVLFVNKVKELEMVPGLALDLRTQMDGLDEKALEKVDQILLMSVDAGFSNQVFDRRVLDKIKMLRNEAGFEGDIWVDGGVNKDTIIECKEAGANKFSVTSGIWGEKDSKKAFKNLNKLVNS